MQLDESLIERYVRYRTTLPEAVIREIETLLTESAEAREIARFYTECYEEYDVAADEDLPERVKQFIEQKSTPPARK